MYTVGEGLMYTVGEGLMYAVGEGVNVYSREGLMYTVGEGLMYTVGEGLMYTVGKGLMYTIDVELSAFIPAYMKTSLNPYMTYFNKKFLIPLTKDLNMQRGKGITVHLRFSSYCHSNRLFKLCYIVNEYRETIQFFCEFYSWLHFLAESQYKTVSTNTNVVTIVIAT